MRRIPGPMVPRNRSRRNIRVLTRWLMKEGRVSSLVRLLHRSEAGPSPHINYASSAVDVEDCPACPANRDEITFRGKP